MLQAVSKACSQLLTWLACFALSATSSQAAQDGTSPSCALPEQVAAQIGDWQLDRDLLRTLFQQQRLGEENLTPDAFINDVMVDTLLARHALASYGDSAWGEETRVGFPLAVKLEDQRVSLASQLTGKRLQAWVSSRFGSSAEQQFSLRITDSHRLQELLTSELTFQDLLSESQLTRLAKVPAAELAWPQAETAILSLAEAWRRTNVQERLGLQQGDLSILRQVADRWAQGQIVDVWLAQDPALSVNEKRFFTEFPQLRWISTVTRKRLGVVEVMHESNPALTERAAQVTPEESRRYYEALQRGSKIASTSAMKRKNPEFSRIALVEAEQIILPDEASAQSARDAIAAGMRFEEALKRFHGQGPSRITLQRQEQMGWLHATAFALPEQELSKPIRMPAASGNPEAPRNWAVIRVISKQREWMPADNPSIHYQASLTIAKDALQSDYRKLLTQLRAENEICIRPDWSATP